MLEIFTIVGFVIAGLGLVTAIWFGVATLRTSAKEGSRTRDEIVTSSKATLEAIGTSSKATQETIQEAIVTSSKATQETIQEAIVTSSKATQETIGASSKAILETIAKHSSSSPNPRASELRGRALIHGAGAAGKILAKMILDKCAYGGVNLVALELIGFIDDNKTKQEEPVYITYRSRKRTPFPILGDSDQVASIIKNHHIDVVVTAIGKPDPSNIEKIKKACSETGATWHDLTFTIESHEGSL